MRQHDLRRAVAVERGLVAVHDEAAGMDPFRMIDAAAIGPVALDHVSAVDAPGIASRHAVAGQRRIGALAVNGPRARVGNEGAGRRRHHARHHRAPAGRAVGPGQLLDDLHRLDESEFPAAQRLGQKHGVNPRLAQRRHDAIALAIEAFGLLRLGLDERYQRLRFAHERGEFRPALPRRRSLALIHRVPPRRRPANAYQLARIRSSVLRPVPARACASRAPVPSIPLLHHQGPA